MNRRAFLATPWALQQQPPRLPPWRSNLRKFRVSVSAGSGGTIRAGLAAELARSTDIGFGSSGKPVAATAKGGVSPASGHGKHTRASLCGVAHLRHLGLSRLFSGL
jgi:hypothetical protein